MEITVNPNTRPPFLKWLIIFFGALLVLAAILIGASFALAYKYENKIYPGVKIDNVSLGGLTEAQATNVVSGKFKQTYGHGFTFVFNNNTKQIANDDILKLNLESMISSAYGQGHANNLFKRQLKLLVYPIFKKKILLDYQLDKNLLKEKLLSEFAILENPARNSEIVLNIIDADKRTYDLSFASATIGESFNFNEAINFLDNKIKSFKNPTITLSRAADYPKITTEQAMAQTERIKQLLALPEIEFYFDQKTWPIKWSDFSHWLSLDTNSSGQTEVVLNQEMLGGQLDAIAQEINQKAVDAKLQIKSGRAVEFEASQQGQALNIETSLANINEQILVNAKTQVELTVNVTEPEISVATTNDLGIKELIGSGFSTFSGSPVNRRHNIGVGAATLNGFLIKPGEEFSLVKSLGEIDAQGGYKPELVIKANKTVPEYGGGLCQIATTVFRAALASGLKITARKNHAYRVPYYEPAGTDATIYVPLPDVKFINDTEHYILIQTKMWGDNLTFEFWGTKDSRVITFEGQNKTSNLKELKPKIFNVTNPGPAKEIETSELKPGEKKRVEYAHAGADTVFYRYIKRVDGTEEKETWSSHYKAWQAVWLIGVDPTKVPPIETAPTAPLTETISTSPETVVE
ncbi:MAG: VanW family protein [Patescibacteria group bacterium]